MDYEKYLGKEYSNKYGVYKTTKFAGRDSTGNALLEIEFHNTRSKCIAQVANIVRGNVRDYWCPSVAGIGFLADSTLEQRKLFKHPWQSMLVRCYTATSSGYYKYGAKGVTVSSRWHNFKNYADDIVLLSGWDLDMYMFGLISLDKDKLQVGSTSKVYGKDTCCWLTRVDQCSLRDGKTAIKSFIAVNPDGVETVVSGLGEFATDNSLSAGNISMCLSGKRKSTKGWTFKNID